MTITKQVALTLAITLFSLLAITTAQAQTPRMTTVNISAQSDRVHITTEGDVSELRVDVADEQGDVVFQSGQMTGNTLDWNMKDAQGERVAAGTYLVTVTFHTAAGKLRKRVEQVTVAEDEKASTKTTAAPNAVQAAITGAGTTGKIAKFTGGATIGNSVITESAAKIGIGTAAPTSVLTVTSTAANNPALLSSDNALGGIGVKGTSSNATGIGVWGVHTAVNGTTPGVKGETNSKVPDAVGVLGVVTSTNPGDLSAGVRGTNKGTSVYGVGVYGEHAGNGPGVFGKSTGGDGVIGISDSGFGVSGFSTSERGVYGQSTSGDGVIGLSTSGDGVSGFSSTGYAGYFGGKAKVTGNLEVEGRVGIGTSTPRVKLDVAGPIFADGDIFTGGFLAITSSSGRTCWFINVSDTGVLSTGQASCPSR